MNEMAVELIRARMARTGESAEVAAHALAMKCKPGNRAYFHGANFRNNQQKEQSK
jgi:hypothetical protein